MEQKFLLFLIVLSWVGIAIGACCLLTQARKTKIAGFIMIASFTFTISISNFNLGKITHSDSFGAPGDEFVPLNYAENTLPVLSMFSDDIAHERYDSIGYWLVTDRNGNKRRSPIITKPKTRDNTRLAPPPGVDSVPNDKKNVEP